MIHDGVALHSASDRRLRWWSKPQDAATLRVLADLWAEKGELRGEFVQLSLLPQRTPAQEKRLSQLLRDGGKLIGPARPYLREWRFGANGVVDTARCEADKLVEGIASLAKVSLERLSSGFTTWPSR